LRFGVRVCLYFIPRLLNLKERVIYNSKRLNLNNLLRLTNRL
jgi:hypothetical protein